MKIALIRQRYTPFGGAERFVANAVQALRAEGASLTVVTRQWESGSEGESLICNPPYLGSLWRDWSFARCVCDTLQKHSFDLVQSHERIACCDIYRAGDGVHREWLKQRRRVLGPLGKLGLALNPYHRYILAAEKKLFSSPRLKAVICNSQHGEGGNSPPLFRCAGRQAACHLQRRGSGSFPSWAERTAPAATSALAYDIPQDAPLFLFVGSGFERKGLATLLQAMTRLARRRPSAGGRQGQTDEAFTRQSGKTSASPAASTFAGGQKDVKPFYGAADAFVLPTLYDPFPNAALEAFACGLPVITSTKSGAAELIREGENGFTCDALDQRAIELKRCSKLLSPALRRNSSASGARHSGAV